MRHLLALIMFSSSILTASDSETYKLIRSVVLKYKRPITILDFGAGDGYQSFTLAQEFPQATCVMIEDNNTESNIVGDSLLNRCHQHKHLKNIIYLKKFLSTKELLRLSECEQFDVVILGNVLHYFGKKWEIAFRIFCQMSDHLIIENPPAQANVSIISNHTRRAIDRFFKKNKTPILGKVSRKNSSQKSTVYLLYTGNHHSIQRANYTCQEKLLPGSHLIDSSHNHKKLIKDKNGKVSTRNWIAGINFFTFKMLNGQFPEKKTLASQLSNQNSTETAHNIILQGSIAKQINRTTIDI